MELKDISVEIRRKDLTRVGQIRAEDLNFEIRPLHNDVGDWTLELPAEHPMVPALREPGSGIIVTIKESTYSGPTSSYTRKTTGKDFLGTFVFKGFLDNRILSARCCWPNPLLYTVTPNISHDVRFGSCEELMHAFTTFNIGPAAVTQRRHPNLVMGPNLFRGQSVRKSARYTHLPELLNELGTLGGLGYRVHQVGDELVFETYAISDKSNTIRLDVDNGSLESDEVSLEAPSVTHVIVAGQGELVERQFILMSTPESEESEDDWGLRIEKFLDQRHTSDVDELEEGGLEVLTSGGSQLLKVRAMPADNDMMEFGRDWFLGDKVTVVVEDIELADTVTGAVIKVDANGVRVGVMIGGEYLGPDLLSALDKRVSNLERNTSAAAGLSVDVVALENRMGVAEDDISTLEDNQSTLTGAVSALQTDVGNLEDDVSDLQSLGVRQVYSPSLTASGSNPTLAFGSSITGQYSVIGKTVHVWIYLDLSGGFSNRGSGAYGISLPVTPMSVPYQNLMMNFSDGTTEYKALAKIEDGQVKRLAYWGEGANSLFIRDDLPASWTAGRVVISGTYLAA